MVDSYITVFSINYFVSYVTIIHLDPVSSRICQLLKVISKGSSLYRHNGTMVPIMNGLLILSLYQKPVWSELCVTNINESVVSLCLPVITLHNR